MATFMYHYSPKTGNTSQCRAQDPKNCPFGGHALGQTAEEAFDKSRFAYEAVMADLTLTSLSKKDGKTVRVYDHKVAAAR